jgi:hypothetical protein
MIVVVFVLNTFIIVFVKKLVGPQKSAALGAGITASNEGRRHSSLIPSHTKGKATLLPSLPPSLTYVVASPVHDDGGGHNGLVQLGVLLGNALRPALVEGGADDGNVLDVVPGPLL